MLRTAPTARRRNFRRLRRGLAFPRPEEGEKWRAVGTARRDGSASGARTLSFLGSSCAPQRAPGRRWARARALHAPQGGAPGCAAWGAAPSLTGALGAAPIAAEKAERMRGGVWRRSDARVPPNGAWPLPRSPALPLSRPDPRRARLIRELRPSGTTSTRRRMGAWRHDSWQQSCTRRRKSDLPKSRWLMDDA